jgi:hypothetical protein
VNFSEKLNVNNREIKEQLDKEKKALMKEVRSFEVNLKD